MKNLFDYIIKKTELNTYKMMRYGSIAVISMSFILLFFGFQNAMLAFPIALTSIAISFENISINPLKKLFELCILDILLVTLSYFATAHIYIGIFINFFTIFAIAYYLSFSYNPKIYKPFLMLFIFTSFSHDNFESLVNKYLIVVVCCCLVVFINLIIDENKKDLLNDFKPTLDNISKQFELLLENNFDITLYKKIYNLLLQEIYKVYIDKTKTSITSIKGELRLKILLSINELNEYTYNIKDKKIADTDFKKIKELISIFKLDKTKSNKNFEKKLTHILENTSDSELLKIIKVLRDTLKKYNEISPKKLNSFSEWKRSKIQGYKELLKRKFHRKSIRLKFALRISITLTICLFSSHLIAKSKIIWISITIMSVMQIYYEETLFKSKDRIKGNAIGITIFCLVSLLNNKNLLIFVLLISLYLTYGFKSYYKLSIFTTLASLCVTALYMNVHELALTRAFLVIVGLIIVFVANRVLFRTKLEDGIQLLISELLFYEYLLYKNLVNINSDSNTYPELIILTLLTTDKIKLRNSVLKNTQIENLLNSSTKKILKLSNTLINRQH
ncbi:MAG: FUSC family protein [Sarcina sp.]